LPGYTSLSEVGLDGEYVSPLQIVSRSFSVPVLIAYNWFDAPSAIQNRTVLQELGYMPGIPFNVVLDKALSLCGLKRSELYMTQAFHLLPGVRSGRIPFRDVEMSFDTITRYEIAGRAVVALGTDAARVCRRFSIDHVEVPHPSARTGSYEHKAAVIAAALQRIS
jgi:hypothetical protein